MSNGSEISQMSDSSFNRVIDDNDEEDAFGDALIKKGVQNTG